MQKENKLIKSLGTWEVMVAGIALVVASSTLVSDFTGFFSLGIYFAAALLGGFIINLLLGLTTAELAVSYPKAGAVYNYAKEIFKGKNGSFIGVFLGLTFWGMCAFAVSGETVSGAYAFKSLLNSDYDISFFVLLLTVLAIIPNIFGIKTMAWVNMILLLFMIGIRWFFGIAGFMNIGNSGSWSFDNLVNGFGSFQLLGEGGILIAGLSLAVWSFIGIEFAASLAEEVKNPKRSIPKGIIFGLIIILLTSLVMGVGVAGTQTGEYWQGIVAGELGNNGESPHLAVGYVMFGDFGLLLMSLASIAATLGSITVIYTAMPRILFSIARDGKLFSPGISNSVSKLNSKFRTPINATLITMAVYILPALYSGEVIKWIFSAAYVWMMLYVVFHILLFVNRKKEQENRILPFVKKLNILPITGVCVTIAGIYIAFYGAHLEFGTRALIVLALSFVISILSYGFVKRKKYSLYDLEISEKEVIEELIS